MMIIKIQNFHTTTNLSISKYQPLRVVSLSIHMTHNHVLLRWNRGQIQQPYHSLMFLVVCLLICSCWHWQLLSFAYSVAARCRWKCYKVPSLSTQHSYRIAPQSRFKLFDFLRQLMYLIVAYYDYRPMQTISFLQTALATSFSTFRRHHYIRIKSCIYCNKICFQFFRR